MSKRIFSCIPIAVAILLAGASAPAQQNQSPSTRAADEAVRNKAITLLESLAGQIGTLQSGENRARIGSNIATSLLKHDEKRARGLLVSVEAEIKAGLERVDEDPETAESTRMVFLKLRMDIVERIANYDAELALTFLKATEPDPSVTKSYSLGEWQRTLELRFARQIAATKPETALRLARQSLARGVSYDLLELYRQLEKKDRERALVLYKEIVSKLREVGLVRGSDAMYFALQLARFSPPRADEAAFRELISMFMNLALVNGCGEEDSSGSEGAWFCQQIGHLVPHMEMIDLNKARKLKQWMSEPPESGYDVEVYEEVNNLRENGTVDELLALAEKHPQMKTQIYWEAMAKAASDGDFDRAIKIVRERIDDSGDRQEMLVQLERARDSQSKPGEAIAQVQRHLAELPNPQARISFLLYAANSIGAKDRKSALKLLDQAAELIGAMKPGKQQTEAEIRLATMYCLEKSQHGLDRIQALMPKMNDLVAAAVKLEGYDSKNIRDGEWNMSSNGSVGTLLTQLSQYAGSFARCDFERAVQLASQFERPEIRLMAQLKLAQAILNEPPKRGSRALSQDWQYLR